MTHTFDQPEQVMRRALQLAQRGLGAVEPNPPVGAVVVDDRLRLLGEGWHERFGGPHAEVDALRAAGDAARGATLYVTLEPCCHHGKTPPCTRAVLDAGIARVVVATADPAPHVDGGGIRKLRDAGVTVETGLLQDQARELLAPFEKLTTTGLPWVHAKWAMSLDGRIAARTGHSQWISGERSRERVHELRGRMDAVVVGAGTVRADDPLLTARPPGPRTPHRVVFDSRASLALDSRLVTTAAQAPVLVVASESAPDEAVRRLTGAGVDVCRLPPDQHGRPALDAALQEFGRRRWTNLLVEGGSALLGSLFDQDRVDELHVFVAPKVIGGAAALSPVGGTGRERIPEDRWRTLDVETIDGDVYLRLRRHAHFFGE